MQRVRMSLPYYRALGWEPVVLAIHPDDVAGTREPDLTETYQADIRIVWCGALPLRLTRKVGLGNLGLRAWLALRKAGTRLLREEKFDLVFFSNTQFITFTLGILWRRQFGVPFVIDLQDPWRTNYYERPGAPVPPGGRKYLLARSLAFLLEPSTYRHAGGFMSVSSRYLSDLARRYPWFGEKPQAVIRFGTSEADLEAARRQPVSPEIWKREPGDIHLLYTGASGPIMPHALNVLFAGFRHYRERWPEKAKRFHFHFYGTSYVPKGQGKPSVVPVAEACGIRGSMDEIPHRLGHLESLALQLQADALVLLGSSDLAYSPSKLYPYYLTGKPMLGVVFKGSYLEGMLHELNCATVAAFAPDEPNEPAYDTLARFFDQALEKFPAATQPVRNDVFFRENFLAGHLTREQCRLFERVLTTPHRS